MRDRISRFFTFTKVQRSIRAVIIAWLLIAFWEDLWLPIKGFGIFILQLLFVKKLILPGSEIGLAILRVSAGVILFMGVYCLLLLWLVYFVLPITKLNQAPPAFIRIFLRGLNKHLHGPAVFVRDGQVMGEPDELKRKHRGVAFLDLRSAMTLDRLHHSEDEDLSEESGAPPKVRFSKVQSGAWYAARIRTVGPGLTFIKSHEHITGAVDLRTQTRSRQEVKADTRDGIRVKTSVSATFTLGEPPDMIDVCLGGEGLNQVFIIEWNEENKGQGKSIKSLTPDLGQNEADEVRDFIKRFPDPLSVTSDCPPEKFPYTFDEKRVEQAVYSISSLHDSSTAGLKKWFDWPQDVAVERFRILLSEYPYLSLYSRSGEPQTNNNGKNNASPTFMKELKRRLTTAVRSTGALAFRVVMQINGLPLNLGEAYAEGALIEYPPQTFKTPGVLRDRGIKVIGAGFGELEPPEKVTEQIRNAWLSSKMREKNLKVADYRLEVERIKNNARIRTHQTMNYHFSRILEKQEYSREALAMLVFQELEAAAANPETRKLLPENTLALMNDIGKSLLQSQKDEDGIRSERPFIPPAEDE